jgi:nucleoside-diphosphate-sugar epimerase
MTKILVTGATGRLGGQVVEFLLRRVTGVTNNQTSAFHPFRPFDQPTMGHIRFWPQQSASV